MSKQHLHTCLALFLAMSISAPAHATTPTKLTPKSSEHSVIWEGEAMAFEYVPACELDDNGWLPPEVECGRDSVHVRPKVQLYDQVRGESGSYRNAKVDDLEVWVDGATVTGPDRWRFDWRLSDALGESRDKHIRIAVPEVVNSMSLALRRMEPDKNYYSYVLADYDSVTLQHKQRLREALADEAEKKQATYFAVGLVILVIVLAILRKLVPASIRFFRSAKDSAYQKAHKARESVSKATYDYRVNREVERLRLQEEAEKRREVERHKEALNEQLQVALEKEDHEKAQAILKQLAELKAKKAPGDERGEGGPKE